MIIGILMKTEHKKMSILTGQIGNVLSNQNIREWKQLKKEANRMKKYSIGKMMNELSESLV